MSSLRVCPLCGFSMSQTILDKPAIPIFTRAGDESNKEFGVYKCILKQCERCGHVFQPLSKDLKRALELMYKSSECAQISTPLGVGNWGKERALFLLEKLKMIDKYKTQSVLEIGCGSGYILKILKEMGFQDLVGIEPSIEKTEKINGVLFLKEFVSKELSLNKEFDFIFSYNVYEHIEDIDNMTSFINNHLKVNGEIFIYTPNCHKSLITGDPEVFSHKHAQYFVENSIKYHLSKHEFEVTENLLDDYSIAVYARKKAKNYQNKPFVMRYNDYQKKLDEKLVKVENLLLKNKKTIIHGACNSLHNIIGWLGRDSDFLLVDNDNSKCGKIFFNKKVHDISSVNLEDFDTVLIVPTSFSDAIKSSYMQKGFRGQFVMVN